MDYIRANGSPATFVGLFSALGREDFYKKFGFIVRPSQTLGPGMVFRPEK